MNMYQYTRKIAQLREKRQNLYEESQEIDQLPVKNYKDASFVLREKKKIDRKARNCAFNISQTFEAFNAEKHKELTFQERNDMAKIAGLWGEEVKF